MSGNDGEIAEALVESYLGWWKEAGIETLVSEEKANWLQPKEDARQPSDLPSMATSKPKHDEVPEKALLPAEAWPKNIEVLKEATRSGALFPGNQYGGSPVAPNGRENAKCIIIGDIPEKEEVENGEFGHGPAASLSYRIAQSIGLEPEEVAMTALATTRPATATLPDSDLAALADFARHQIGLIRPKLLLLFGSTACHALLGAEMMKMRGVLQDIKVNDEKVAALTTFHPRTLLARPQMKAQAWKDLQVLIQ